MRTFANGFAIEDLAFGQASGKLAKPGKKACALRPQKKQPGRACCVCT